MNKDWLGTFGKSVEKGLRGELGNILEKKKVIELIKH